MKPWLKSLLLGAAVGFTAGVMFLLGAVFALLMQTQRYGQWDARIAAVEQKVGAIESGIKSLASGRGRMPQVEDNNVYPLDMGASPVWGKADAPVVITMFSDFQCPYCARGYAPIKEVMKAYPKKVAFVLKNFPLDFHKKAIPG